SEEHTSELQSPCNLVCRLLREKKLASRKKLRAPVVDDHDVQFPAGARSVEVGGVGGDRLSGGAPREEPQKHAEVLRAWHDLLNAHASDVEGWQSDAEVGVSLVGANDQATCLGDGEVHAGEPGLRGEELRAQVV